MSQASVIAMRAVPVLSKSRQMAWQAALMFPILLLPLVLRSIPPEASWQTVSGLLLMALVITAAVTDWLWYKIPNWATYSAFLWALGLNVLATFASERTCANLGTVGLADSLLGASLPFLCMFLVFTSTAGGAGDVKLTAAMGALLGISRVIDVILLSFVFAGGFALTRAIWWQGPVRVVAMVVRGIGHFLVPFAVLPPNEEQIAFLRQPLPLGPFFALGALCVLFRWNPATAIMEAWL